MGLFPPSIVLETNLFWWSAFEIAMVAPPGLSIVDVKLDEKPPDEPGPEDDVFDINDRQTWGRYHSDFKRNPPKTICFQHYRWGKQAHFCRGLGQCPWENYTAPKTK